MSTKFRPSSYPKHLIVRDRLEGRHIWGPFRERRTSHRPNDRWIFRSFGILHYYTSHAPEAVNLKWRQAELRFNKRYCNASVRYCEKFSFTEQL